MTKITALVDDEIKEKLDAISKATGCALPVIIRSAVTEYVETWVPYILIKDVE